ncbi:hypothetical protein JCM21714_1525 [Gracilibacillus boraciitolerans JCM 21714]|uniref:N-acetyltransferase domain-containing protein n=1 Tax=Gracilibacillus boraciitolerans JCM 21714 TaxID=1298598 RepID=W4VID5_9BACI|nr:hypothetical protein [Gracilibacillus boraciitolerans]GAE92519.1 hypothetical protein JCM21714_1525 [Gracilibacillus boraciitolerans JCM 21714]
MELKSTKELDQAAFESFFNENSKMLDVDQAEMKKYGYFLYKDQQPTAFFSLLPVDGGESYWLRTLMIKRSPSLMLPVTIIQSAENLTKSYGAKHLFIHSKTEILNQLLEQLGYTQTEQCLDPLIEANWWITSLESVDNYVNRME